MTLFAFVSVQPPQLYTHLDLTLCACSLFDVQRKYGDKLCYVMQGISIQPPRRATPDPIHVLPAKIPCPPVYLYILFITYEHYTALFVFASSASHRRTFAWSLMCLSVSYLCLWGSARFIYVIAPFIARFLSLMDPLASIVGWSWVLYSATRPEFIIICKVT